MFNEERARGWRSLSEPKCFVPPWRDGSIWREPAGYACYRCPNQPAGHFDAVFPTLNEAAVFMESRS